MWQKEFSNWSSQIRQADFMHEAMCHLVTSTTGVQTVQHTGRSFQLHRHQLVGYLNTFKSLLNFCKSCDSSVSIVLGCRQDNQGSRVQFPAGALFTTVSRMALEPTQLPIQWVPGALSLGVKQLGHEADHSPTYSAEIKNAWSYTSTPPICLHGMVLS
jgi:hypothetical protein